MRQEGYLSNLVLLAAWVLVQQKNLLRFGKMCLLRVVLVVKEMPCFSIEIDKIGDKVLNLCVTQCLRPRSMNAFIRFGVDQSCLVKWLVEHQGWMMIRSCLRSWLRKSKITDNHKARINTIQSVGDNVHHSNAGKVQFLEWGMISVQRCKGIRRLNTIKEGDIP